MRDLPRSISITFLTLSFLGLLDSLYLYISHVRGASLLCGTLKGCDIVAASPYSTMGGVPLSLLGVLFYAGMLILSAAIISHDRFVIRQTLAVGAFIGALASIWFEYIQLVLIGAWCIYCLFSALITWSMALCILFYRPSFLKGAALPIGR
jgi:uncharacterized membrane protein